MALSSSKRVLLIKEIATRLSAEEWPFIDLTLNQFSLPTSDTWGGSKPTYVLKMLEGASDRQLIELGQHVGFQFDEAGPQRVDPPFGKRERCDCYFAFGSRTRLRRCIARSPT